MIGNDRAAQLSRLLYTSTLVADAKGEQDSLTARKIAESSASRNKASGLTGSLLFVDGSFIQILEGPALQLESTFERICCDFRHSEVRLIDLMEVPGRLFSDWDMAFLYDNEETSLALRDGLQEIRFLVGVNSGQAIRQMRSLVASHAPEPAA